ncbi:hypothetical protein [Glycomyces sp. MUSA5-2]|uniref:hypothetical protein n=1 Tax=Glycomyces sp. MUSA5-2 TaxID=2053002 RepID=UPI003009FDB6
MTTVNTFTFGHFEYALDLPDERDQRLAAAMLLRRTGEADPLGSLQQLHTDTPELVVYDWVEPDERARLEVWASDILAHAQAVWRAHTSGHTLPSTILATPQRSRWRNDPELPVILALGIAVALQWALAIVLPDSTPELAAAALVGVVCVGSFLGVYWVLRGVRRALQVAWRIAALVAVLLLAGAVAGHLSGDAPLGMPLW